MAGLDPAIQNLFGAPTRAGWMAASRAAMTKRRRRATSIGQTMTSRV